VALLGRDPATLSLYDASLSEWAAADDLPMVP
jgi:3-mercaptopyruvate sulfurtransferase SseA